MSSNILHKFDKRKVVFYTAYTVTSIWGLAILVTIMTNPLDYSNLSIGGFIGAVFGALLLLLGPLGVVFAVDRYLKNRNKRQ